MIKGFVLAAFTLSVLSLASCAKNKNTKSNAASSQQQSAQAAAAPISVEPKMAGDRVFFDFDSFAITIKATEILKANAEYINSKKLKVVISGHCDERGSVAYNYKLGLSRANAVRDALVSYGVNPSSIKIVSKGEKSPIAKGKGEDVWSKNRVGIFHFDNFKKLSLDLSNSSMVSGDVTISVA